MKAMTFDLDNTLYDVSQYYLGGFREIAEYLSKKYNLSSQKIYKKLKDIWDEKTSMHHHLFDDALDFFSCKKELNRILGMFNDYEGELRPYPHVALILEELKKRKYKLGIITDGDVDRQKRKVRLLGLGGLFDEIILTKELGSLKPSVVPFQEMINRLGVTPQESLYVGDNPLLDFEGAKKAGMKTVRLLKGEFKDMLKNEYIDYEIREFKDLLSLVNND